MSSGDGRVTARKPARRRRDFSGFDDTVGRDAPIVEVTVELVDAPSGSEAPSASGNADEGGVVDVHLLLPPEQ